MVQKSPTFEVGTKFGEWTVIEQQEREVNVSGMKRAWFSRVRCVCGTEKYLANNYLRAGHSNGCGCRRGQALGRSGTTHNKSRTPTYRLWHTIKQRLKFDRRYEGITMHESWVHDFPAFEAFIESLGPKPTPEHTLDRIDPNGHYEPGNLRWADKTLQSVNRRNSMLRNIIQNSVVKVGQKYDMLTVLDVFVIEKHGRNWYGAKVECECGTIKTVYQQQLLSPKTKSCGCFKNRNIDLAHKALEKPIEANGRSMSMAAWARETGISKHVIWNRIHKLGWDPARAVTEPIQDPLIEVDGERLRARDWSKRYGVPTDIIHRRIDERGWDPVLAVKTPVRKWTRKDKQDGDTTIH